MKTTYQYRMYPQSHQAVRLNEALRLTRYWYNRMLGERLDWWERNRCPVNSCPLICHLPELKDNPNYFTQKQQLPTIKEDLVLVEWSGELLDFSSVYSTVLQDVCKRVQKAFERYIRGDKNGKRSGKPRFKNQARYRTLVFDGAQDSWLRFCTRNGRWLYLNLPKIGLVKVRTHRPLPSGFKLKQVSVTSKSDGWYVSFIMEDVTVPEATPTDIVPTWDNAMGIDAVLEGNVYIATSEGYTYPSLKPLRKRIKQLASVSRKKSARKKGSRARRKLAFREARLHSSIARERKDFQYKTAHSLVSSGKKVFFYEDLNLKGLTRRNALKRDLSGKYLPNQQSAKSGLNKSWLDASFGQFFEILGHVAAKAGAVTVAKNPSYTSQILCYKDEFVFTDCSIREYWDKDLKFWIDRDINAAINLLRLGLDVFPRIKRLNGKPVVVSSTTNSTATEALTALMI